MKSLAVAATMIKKDGIEADAQRHHISALSRP